MQIRNIGDLAVANGKVQTVELRTHAGDMVIGNLNTDAHVRFFTADERADRLARTGIDFKETVGTLVGERYSADALASVINHPSNPLGFDPSVLPYKPTDEDRLDCQVIRGLWDGVIVPTLLRLQFASEPSGPTTPDKPSEDPAVAKLKAMRALLSGAMKSATKNLPEGARGIPAQTCRTLMAAVEAALKNSE